MNIDNMAKFVSIDKNISFEVAKKISAAISKTQNLKAVKNYYIFCKYEYKRVYFEIWSQNNLDPITFFSKCYYDADKDDFFVKKQCFGKILIERVVDQPGSGKFSGARTREAFNKFIEAVIG